LVQGRRRSDRSLRPQVFLISAAIRSKIQRAVG
jgi:hypothetical protein